MTDAMPAKRFQWIVIGIAAAVLVVVIAGVVVVVNAVTGTLDQARFESCMADYGYERGQPYDSVEGIVAASELCGR